MHDVLVRVSRPGDAGRSVCCAARIAAGLKGGLTGLHVVPTGAPPPSLYDPGFAAAEWAIQAQEQVRAAQDAAPAFVDWAAAMGVARASWVSCAGYLPELLGSAGQWHDLLVLGIDPDGEDAWTRPPGIARIVLASPIACLLVPPSVEMELPCDTVAIAWNGSIEALRAVRAAVPLLEGARRILVLSGECVDTSPLRPQFDLRQWLEARFGAVEYRMLEPGRQQGADIVDAVHACQADLLVMGAYGRSRAAEWILGGVTRHMLRHADFPILMRH
ncbi:MAG TPA: universal stress protein [Lysobacter sp.]